jgi:hypothetical protein
MANEWFAQEFVAEVDGVEYKVGDEVYYPNLCWSSDWNGDEVGFDDIDVVGLYSFPNTEIYIYVNVENGVILDIWNGEEEEE